MPNIRTYVRTLIHTLKRMYIHATIGTILYVHTNRFTSYSCIHAYIRTYIHTYIHTYVRMYVQYAPTNTYVGPLQSAQLHSTQPVVTGEYLSGNELITTVYYLKQYTPRL